MSDRLVAGESVRTAAGVTGDAVLIRDARVVGVGRREDLTRPGLPEDRFPGAVIIPGLRDAHLHPVSYAAALAGNSLKTASDMAEVSERLRASARRLSPEAPLTAVRFDDERIAEGKLPTRRDLDAAVPDRPVLVYRYCGHVAMANTPALDLAGIGPDSPDPVGGSLDRDREGVPTGVLRETAVELVAIAIARSGWRPVAPGDLLEAIRGLASVGLTSVGVILGCGRGPWASYGDEVKAVAEIGAELPIKLNALVVAQDPDELEAAALRLDAAGPRVRFIGLKAFGDGSLGGHTAALHEPFSDRPDETGTLRLDHDWGLAMSRSALDLGGRVAIHAIGDRANARVLDVFEQLIDEGADPARLRVEHASVLGRQEIDRFTRSGVTASVQPAFLVSETTWLESRVGPERLRTTYPLRTLRDAGVPLAGGSDSPVEPPHPLWGMAAARDRAGIVPEEGLTPEDAFALFTDWSARAMGEEQPLAPGSPADFVVLDRDPVTATEDDLRSTTVLSTWVDGNRVDVPADTVAWRE